VGWIDNQRLLVNSYNSNNQVVATIYNSAGAIVGTPNLPELPSIQTVNSDSVYCPKLNTIFSLSSGAPTWTSPNPTTGVAAVAGSYVVYASGTRVLVDTY
jgi:hypothetical protein